MLEMRSVLEKARDEKCGGSIECKVESLTEG